MLKRKFDPYKKRIPLSTPTIHEEDRKWMLEGYDTGWVTTAGENINEVEKISAKENDVKYAVGLSCATAALHLCAKLMGERLYGIPSIGHGSLEGKKVFCTDMTFAATLNPVVYEGAEPVFIDTEYETWNMSPKALEKAFELYPDCKLVVFAHLYGFPGKIKEIVDIAHKHGALVIEDAAEAMGATIDGRKCGSFGDVAAISFNGNKIITGSAGGCLLTNNLEDANKARKWATQARESAPWYEHEEVGYNYRMSNIIAGIIRGQYEHIDEHINQKKTIYEKYKKAFKDLPVTMNPIMEGSDPNYWLSCLLINNDAMCKHVRSDREGLFVKEEGKSCPTEILEAMNAVKGEGRPIWKPMHMQPMYRLNPFITVDGNIRGKTNAYIKGEVNDVSSDIFNRGLCLPTDNKMTEEEQDYIIEVVKACFE